MRGLGSDVEHKKPRTKALTICTYKLERPTLRLKAQDASSENRGVHELRSRFLVVSVLRAASTQHKQLPSSGRHVLVRHAELAIMATLRVTFG